MNSRGATRVAAAYAVAAILYLVETAIILTAAQVTGANITIVFFVLIAFTANSTHSILGTAAAMDIGGRRMAGFASGCIDSFQYFGQALAGALLGSIVEKNWDHYFYFMAPFGVIGAALMFSMRFLPPAPPKLRTEEPTQTAEEPSEL